MTCKDFILVDVGINDIVDDVNEINETRLSL